MTQNPTAGKSLNRKQITALWNGASNTVTSYLQRANLYRALGFRLQCTPTVAGASNTVANTKKGDEWGCINQLRVSVNGTDTLFLGTGDDLYMLNKRVYGMRPRITPTLGDAQIANPALDSTLMLPIWNLRGRKPMDTALESWNYGSLQVDIQFNDWTSINSAASAWTANPQVDIYGFELSPAFQADGKTLKFRPPFRARTVRQTTDFATAQTAGKIVLDGAPYHKGVLINIQANGGGNDLINTLTNLKLYDGNRLVRDYDAALLGFSEIQNGEDPAIEIDASNIARQTRGRISQGSDPRAWYYVPLCDDGLLSEAVGGVNTGDFYFLATTTAACRAVVIDEQVMANEFL